MHEQREYKLATRRGPSPFGHNLRTIRVVRGLTQLTLGTRCAMHSSQISHYETGVKQYADSNNLARFADALRCTVDNLLRQPRKCQRCNYADTVFIQDTEICPRCDALGAFTL